MCQASSKLLCSLLSDTVQVSLGPDGFHRFQLCALLLHRSAVLRSIRDFLLTLLCRCQRQTTRPRQQRVSSGIKRCCRYADSIEKRLKFLAWTALCSCCTDTSSFKLRTSRCIPALVSLRKCYSYSVLTAAISRAGCTFSTFWFCP